MQLDSEQGRKEELQTVFSIDIPGMQLLCKKGPSSPIFNHQRVVVVVVVVRTFQTLTAIQIFSLSGSLFILSPGIPCWYRHASRLIVVLQEAAT